MSALAALIICIGLLSIADGLWSVAKAMREFTDFVRRHS